MVGNRPASRMKGRKRGVKDTQDKSETSPKKDSVLDESIVSKPIETSVSGLCKAIKVMETGTPEIQDYLRNECDIILECRVCHNLFRSLANFIIHKRKYCAEIYSQKLHMNYKRKFQDDEEWLITSDVSKNEEDEEINENNNQKSKDLSSIIDRLAKKKIENCKESALDLNKIVERTLRLQTVDGSEKVMFQTMFEKTNVESEELMKSELMELHDMTDNDGAVIGPDGHCLGFRTVNEKDISSQDAVRRSLLMGNTCVYCNMKFSTRKTLKYHINSKHNNSRIVYPCPECLETFVNLWGVFRHLYKVHRKTAAQVRKLRDLIQSRAFRMDQAPLKKTQTDSICIPTLTEEQKREEENKAWMDNLESDNDFQCCGGCGRRFERRAALNSHSQICQKRIAARNNSSGNKMKQRIFIEDEKQNKPVIKGARKRKSSIKKIILAKNIFDKFSSESNSPNSSRPQSVVGNFEISEIIGCDPLLLSKSQEISNPGSPSSSSTKSIKLIEPQDPLDDKNDVHELEKDPLADYASSSLDMITCSDNPIRQDVYGNSITENESRISDHFIIVPNLPNKNEEDATKHFNECTIIEENSLSASDVSIQPESSVLITQSESEPKYIHDFFGHKIRQFVEIGKKYTCVPCECKFSTLVGLRRHMASHFNWKRFRCVRCDYLSFDKRPCIVHAQTTHHATVANIKKYIIKISLNESIKKCSETFLPINNGPQEIITLDDSDEDKKPGLEILTSLNSDKEQEEQNSCTVTGTLVTEVKNKEHITENQRTEQTTELSREFIMEMIGINEMTQSFEVVKLLDNNVPLEKDIDLNETNRTSKELSENVIQTYTKTRPVRNRVKPVNKDFIYDMSTLPKHDNDNMVYVSKTYKRKTDEADRINMKLHSAEIVKKKKRRRNSKTSHSVSSSEKSDNSSSIDEPTTSIKIVPVLLTEGADMKSFSEINDDIDYSNKNSIFENLVDETITDGNETTESSTKLPIDSILSIIS